MWRQGGEGGAVAAIQVGCDGGSEREGEQGKGEEGRCAASLPEVLLRFHGEESNLL